MTGSALEAAFSLRSAPSKDSAATASPIWGEIDRELKRKHVTLAVLSDEYIERRPDGYRYSRFCELYLG
jgi:transposase